MQLLTFAAVLFLRFWPSTIISHLQIPDEELASLEQSSAAIKNMYVAPDGFMLKKQQPPLHVLDKAMMQPFPGVTVPGPYGLGMEAGSPLFAAYPSQQRQPPKLSSNAVFPSNPLSQSGDKDGQLFLIPAYPGGQQQQQQMQMQQQMQQQQQQQQMLQQQQMMYAMQQHESRQHPNQHQGSQVPAMPALMHPPNGISLPPLQANTGMVSQPIYTKAVLPPGILAIANQPQLLAPMRQPQTGQQNSVPQQPK